jgi:hypothetical protein
MQKKKGIAARKARNLQDWTNFTQIKGLKQKIQSFNGDILVLP